ncbi:VOC family protein [Actinomadura nitritigenes]|uniref:VOC family protein n=1 Tax=Actinomadura nitritigenes TaxID=134602 RepID=UPI003D8A3943
MSVRVQRVNAKVERLTSAGATVLRTLGGPDLDHFAVGLLDPEGNEFCVALSHKRGPCPWREGMPNRPTRPV